MNTLTLFRAPASTPAPQRGRRAAPRAPRERAPSPLGPLLREPPRKTAPAPAQPAAGHDLPTTGGGLTLDDLVVGAWEGLSAHRTVPCPACGGALAPRYGAGAGPVGGRCGDCATTIS